MVPGLCGQKGQWLHFTTRTESMAGKFYLILNKGERKRKCLDYVCTVYWALKEPANLEVYKIITVLKIRLKIPSF